MVRHYAAYMRAWLQVTPETSVTGNRAELRLNFGKKMFVAVFGCRKGNWSLCHVEVRRGEQTATFTRASWRRRWPPYSGTSRWHPRPRRSMPPRGRGLTPRCASGAPR
jgi:hypothetical protein